MSVFFHRVEENVYKDDQLPGSGSFISCLKKVMIPIENNSNLVFSMGSVYKAMKAIVNGAPQTALNVRAVHGSIHLSNKIMLGPIFDKKKNTVVYTQCDISSIKADGAKKISDVLFEGNVGGIIFKSIKDIKTNSSYDIHFIEKQSDISILDSTILFFGQIKEGDILKIEVPKKEYITINGGLDDIYSRVLHSLMPFDQVYLFWYGKIISVNIVEIAFKNDRVCLSAIISKCDLKSVNQFVLPINENEEIRHKDNILLAIPRTYYSTMPPEQVQNKLTYVNCYISDIKNSTDYDIVKIKSSSSMCICSVLTEIVHFECSENEKEFDIISIPIKNISGTIDIYSILTKVGRNIRKWFSRQAYRQYGGVEIQLLNNDILREK